MLHFVGLKEVKALEASFHVFPQCLDLKENWGNVVLLRETGEIFC